VTVPSNQAPDVSLEPDVLLDDVSRAEREAVDRRRAACGLEKGDAPPVGLALSGGGVRSGAVGLGFLRALHRTNVLRGIDYLSSVSGGGYASAFFISAATAAGVDRADGDAPSDRPLKQKLDEVLGAPGEERLPDRMMRFVRGGNYLKRMSEFLNRQLIGVLLIWLLVGSGLTCIAALTACGLHWLMRPAVRSTLTTIWPNGDVAIVLFPSAVCLVAWGALWLGPYLRYLSGGPRPIGRLARYAFFAALISALAGLAALIGMGDLGLGQSLLSLGVKEEALSGAVALVKWATIAVVAIGLLPFIRPRALLRSGTDPEAGSAERVVYWIATRALVFGVPFLLVAIFARENVAGSFGDRERFERPDISEWSDDVVWAPLWLQVRHENEPEGLSEPSRKASEFLWGLNVDLSAPVSGGEPPADSLSALGLEGTPEDLEKATMEQTFGLLEQVAIRRRVLQQRLFNSAGLLKSARAVHAGDLLEDRELSLLETDLKRSIMAALNGALLGNADTREAFIEATAGTGSEEVAQAAKDAFAASVVAEGTDAAPREPHRRRLYETQRALLASVYGDAIRGSDVVTNYVVGEEDQAFRLQWAAVSFVLFFVAALMLDLNATSWHWFYSDRLREAWIDPVGPAGRNLLLRDLRCVDVGAPYPLINASLHLPGRRTASTGGPERPTRDHFLFSPEFCGSPAVGFQSTARYADGEVRLDDAVALSGGAVTPLRAQNPLQIAFLAAVNARLGQWVPNPGYRPKRPRLHSWWSGLRQWPVTPFGVIWNLFVRDAERRSTLFVTDGGHTENLGVGPLLARRCGVIVAVDAGQDGAYAFNDFRRLIRWARASDGIVIEPKGLDDPFALLTPDFKRRRSRRRLVEFRIRYPARDGLPAFEGTMLYVKNAVTGKEPLDLTHHRLENPDFPHDPTADQFYDAERFESYRQLGEVAGTEVAQWFAARDAATAPDAATVPDVATVPASTTVSSSPDDGGAKVAPPSADREIVGEPQPVPVGAAGVAGVAGDAPDAETDRWKGAAAR